RVPAPYAPAVLLLTPPPAPLALCAPSLHDALPILSAVSGGRCAPGAAVRSHAGSAVPVPAGVAIPAAAPVPAGVAIPAGAAGTRSEEHTSELQSRFELVCRLLLDKNNQAAARTDKA